MTSALKEVVHAYDRINTSDILKCYFLRGCLPLYIDLQFKVLFWLQAMSEVAQDNTADFNVTFEGRFSSCTSVITECQLFPTEMLMYDPWK